jgi:hypothetical protein
MKKLFFAIFIIGCLLPSMSWADYVDKKLPDITSAQIKDGARQIIELGVSRRHVVKFTKRMIENDFSEEQILSTYNVLIEAKKQHLPEDPLVEKLNEGMAKEVQPEKIILAMEKVRARYETAHTFAKMLSSDDGHVETMTTEIVECMAAGIEADDIQKVSEILRDKSGEMKASKAESLNKRTIRMMKTMARSGVASQDALAVVDSAFENDYSAKDMEGLENSFKLNVRWTSSVSDLAHSYADAINKGATFNDDADFYDPWTTSFGPKDPGSIGSGMPGGIGGPVGIPSGGGGPSGGSPGGSPPTSSASPPTGTGGGGGTGSSPPPGGSPPPPGN